VNDGLYFPLLGLPLPAEQPMACPAGALTNARRTDGFGAQYAALVSVFAWSVLTDVPFCPTAWAEMEHRSNASMMWRLVGGSSLGPAATALSIPRGPLHAQLATKRRLAPAVISTVRAAYFAAPKPPLHWYPPGVRHVAVHVRRGDICARANGYIHHCMPGRSTSNGIAARCALLAAQRLLGATESATMGPGGERYRAPSAMTRVGGVAIHIFSEGEPSDFGALGRIPGFLSHFHLGAPECVRVCVLRPRR